MSSSLTKQEIRKHLVVTTKKAPAEKQAQRTQKPASPPSIAKSTPPKKADPVPSEKKKELIAKAPSKPVVQKAPVKAVATVKAKKIEEKKTVQSKTPPPPAPAIPAHLLQELEESIAKIDVKQDKIQRKNKEQVSSSLKPLAVDTPISSDSFDTKNSEIAYTEMLIAYLREQLYLPEFGEVKVRLTLFSNGKVAKLVVLKTESEKNRQYIENNLPLVEFPSLKEVFNNQESKTFVFAFCNE